MINERLESDDERERLFLKCYKNMQSFLNDHSQENVKIMMKQNGIMNCFIEQKKFIHAFILHFHMQYRKLHNALKDLTRDCHLFSPTLQKLCINHINCTSHIYHDYMKILKVIQGKYDNF